jgi:hypothetical protein
MPSNTCEAPSCQRVRRLLLPRPEAAARVLPLLSRRRLRLRFARRCSPRGVRTQHLSRLTPGAVLTNSLDSPQPDPWVHVNVESKVPWLVISDGLPQFQAWPTPEQVRRLVESHPGSWLPLRLVDA